MKDSEIYNLWQANVQDHRCLRRRRWDQLKKLIIEEKLHSVLEFGTGISTILFSNLKMRVVSFETDPIYLKSITYLLSGAHIRLWNNKNLAISQKFDLALVDGELPRNKQLEIALKSARFVAIDDYVTRLKNQLKDQLEGFTRLDDESTFLAIFKID